MSDKSTEWDFINKALKERKEENRLRTLQPVLPVSEPAEITSEGKRLINFCSNDYLGLSRHPDLVKRSQEYAEQYGVGSTASRLISGSYDIHTELEEKIAEIFSTEAALIFNSGFQANSTILQTITDRNSLILADKRSHNSLLQGALLSRATFQRFDHNDMDHLKALLERASEQSYSRVVIVTESVFSMDGDRSDLEGIADLAERYQTLLFVDDAHAVGVWGEKGLGLGYGERRIDITLGTFGKAFGVFGAFVTCSRSMRDYLVNFCPGFIYTTALPPTVIGALDAAVTLVPQMQEKRKKYHQNIELVRSEIQKAGFNTGSSSTQIIPILVGDEQETVELSDFMKENGILATAIRPPTVPESSSRIRITLSSEHTGQHINRLTEILGRWNGH